MVCSRETVEFEADLLHFFDFDEFALVLLVLDHFCVAEFAEVSLVFLCDRSCQFVVGADAEPCHGLFPALDTSVTD